MGKKGISIFFTNIITVETFSGTDGYGADVFAMPVKVSGYADDSTTIDRTNGEVITSGTTLYTYIENQRYFTPGTRVTIDGVQAHVISANVNGVPGLPLPEHLSVKLG